MKFQIIALLLLVASCTNDLEEKVEISKKYTFDIRNLNDSEYPDNPDIGFRSNEYNENYFLSGEINKTEKSYEIIFLSKAKKDTIRIKNIDLNQFIPTIPKHLKKDKYLSEISLVNQEWNRNQVEFEKNDFETSNRKIKRIDLARNCLNSYLWEIIFYVEEDGKEKAYAHGWFDFPFELYHDLFKEKNKLDFSIYKKVLENWKDPKNKFVQSNLLSKISDTLLITFSDESKMMYPLEGARKSKFKEIVYPESFKTMKDLQSDKTLFATFTQPGYYNRMDPRKTELGRIFNLKNIQVFKTISMANQDTLNEIKFEFLDSENKRKTHLILGGLQFNDFPILSIEKANEGWQNSMGFSNHSFYEKYKEHLKCDSYTNPYYAYLSDGDNNWLDSHKIGIDGPLIHWGDANHTILHVWLLSFERHALVGHYVIKMNK